MTAISVDHDLCQGHGQCQESAPDLFELRDDGYAYVLGSPTTADAVERARDAASRCPVDAIRLNLSHASLDGQS